MISRYSKVEKAINEGAYGVVYKAKDNNNGTIVAMKVIIMQLNLSLNY